MSGRRGTIFPLPAGDLHVALLSAEGLDSLSFRSRFSGEVGKMCATNRKLPSQFRIQAKGYRGQIGVGKFLPKLFCFMLLDMKSLGRVFFPIFII